jgi:hypothetical protein
MRVSDSSNSQELSQLVTHVIFMAFILPFCNQNKSSPPLLQYNATKEKTGTNPVLSVQCFFSGGILTKMGRYSYYESFE